jgi:hypothetical protein
MKREQIQRLVQVGYNNVTDTEQLTIVPKQFLGKNCSHPCNGIFQEACCLFVRKIVKNNSVFRSQLWATVFPNIDLYKLVDVGI